ncbi:MAG TPA: tripartite tricarboxylate transporter substrate binding protein [Burkholderiaceae bacterium]|nr:tripartite tricarboxylate transporter substrate binding protein [Burkholderiaceae bacterium]
MRNGWVTCAVGAALACTVIAARPASDHPSPSIRLIVPGAAGSPPDALARIIGESLTSRGQPVIVDDRPGAIGTLAYTGVAKAAPDGRTLGIVGLPLAVAPSLLAKMPYDTVRDLAPVTQLVWSANVLVVRAASPVASTRDLIAQAKARPSRLSYASAGNGTPSHLVGELFRHRAGIDVQHVPFKGIPAGLTALMGEQVDFAFSGVATALPLIQAGKLRALGSAGTRRLPALPAVPTLVELGIAGCELNEWYGVAAPAGTPTDVLAQLSREFTRIVVSPHVRSRLEQLGLYPDVQAGPDALAGLIRSELQRWRQIVREVGIRGE